MITLTAILFLIPATIFASFGSIYLKKGSDKFTLHPKKLLDNLTAAFGLFLFGLSSLFYIVALKFGDLSIVYPLSSFTYALIALLSIKMLKERMTKKKWIGIFLIVLGSFFMVN